RSPPRSRWGTPAGARARAARTSHAAGDRSSLACYPSSRTQTAAASNLGRFIIFFGKNGELASNRRDQQELTVLCLHVLQAALVYINTLMIQDLLAEPDWADTLTSEDRRGLTPLFTSNMTP